MAWDPRSGPVLEVVHLLPGEAEFPVFRAIKRDEPTLDDFTSASVLQRPPPRRIQKQSAPVWMALSCYVTRQQLESKMKQVPQIGTHAVELVLSVGMGFAYAETVEPGHLSVWGDPFKLAQTVVDIYPVR